MVTALQPSVAVALPVTLVVVTAGYSSVTLVGQVMTGGVRSRTVMVCTRLVALPQLSVAVQVRAMILVPPQRFVTESLHVTVARLQPSVAVATPVALVVVTAGQSSTRSPGMLSEGGVESTTA